MGTENVKQASRQTRRWYNEQTQNSVDRQTDRRETDMQTDKKQTERQTDRNIDRQLE
jgi:hypothetical protein